MKKVYSELQRNAALISIPMHCWWSQTTYCKEAKIPEGVTEVSISEQNHSDNFEKVIHIDSAGKKV